MKYKIRIILLSCTQRTHQFNPTPGSKWAIEYEGLLIDIIEKLRSRKVSKVDELKSAIEALPENEFVELRLWFSEKDWQNWDEQIEADSKSGELDFLIKEGKSWT